MDQLFKRISRKRKMEEEDEEFAEMFTKPSRRAEEMHQDNTICLAGILAGAVTNAKERKQRKRNVQRISSWWFEGYLSWDDAQFKQHHRITRNSFDHILNIVTPCIKKTLTNLCPNPTSPATQLGLTLYRLAHGTIHLTTGVLEELACVMFNKVLVAQMYDDYVKIPDDWEAELRGFLEN